MSREDVERLREYSDAFRGGDVSAVYGFWDPDVEWHDPPETPDASVLRGREAVRRRLEDLLEAAEEFRVEPEEIIDAGNEVVLVWRLTGRWRGGVPLELLLCLVCAVRGGQIVRLRNFLDRAQALEAAGLR